LNSSAPAEAGHRIVDDNSPGGTGQVPRMPEYEAIILAAVWCVIRLRLIGR
jgi:hypothetical protein